jgi:hypothetical protein
MMSALNHDDIRKQVERILRSPLTDTEWQFLVERRHIAEVESRESTASAVAAEVREFRKVFRASKEFNDSKSPVLPKSIAARQAALGAIYAHEADQDRDVKRMRILVGQITEGQVLGWVAATHYASLNLTPNASHEDAVNALAIAYNAGHGMEMERLSYLDGRRSRLLTVVDPLLVKLARLALRLSECWFFSEAAATNFILTGRIPSVWRYRGEQKVKMISKNPLSRIVLELDPDMSPVEVAEVYRMVRNEVKGKRARVRPVSERTAVLAGWVVNRPEEEAWRARRLAWNREYPEWNCGSDNNFARDAHAAVRRLMNPGWRLAPARQ